MKRTAEEPPEDEREFKEAPLSNDPIDQTIPSTPTPFTPIFNAIILSDANKDSNPLVIACDETQSRVLLDGTGQGIFLFRPSSHSRTATLSVVTGPKVLHKRENCSVEDLQACVMVLQENAAKLSIGNFLLFSSVCKRHIPVSSSAALSAIRPVLVADTGASLLVRYKGDTEQEKTEPMKGTSVCSVSISLPVASIAHSLPHLLCLIAGSKTLQHLFIDIDVTASLSSSLLSAFFWRLFFLSLSSLSKLSTVSFLSPLARVSGSFSGIAREITLSCIHLADLTVLLNAAHATSPLLLLTSFSAGLRSEGKDCIANVKASLLSGAVK